MSESEKKDKILTFFNQEENRTGFFQTYDLVKLIFTDDSVNFKEIRYLIDRILSEGYLKGDNSKCQYNFSLTPFLETGGYMGQEAKRKVDAEKMSKRERESDEKNRYDLILSKWQYYAFWFVFGLNIIGSILGIIAFFKS